MHVLPNGVSLGVDFVSYWEGGTSGVVVDMWGHNGGWICGDTLESRHVGTQWRLDMWDWR